MKTRVSFDLTCHLLLRRSSQSPQLVLITLKTLIFVAISISLPSSCFPAGLPTSRNTPSPIDPDTIQVPVSYDPDPADLALSSVPGQEMFDPRKRKFSAEELKPQPMIKKARKVFIPEDLKVICC